MATDVGRNNPCPCGSGKKFKKCHGAPGPQSPDDIERIRVTFHLEPDSPHDVWVFTGPTPQIIQAGDLEGNMLEAFLDLDEDAFHSGIAAEELMLAGGRDRFLEFLRGMAHNPDVRVNVMARNQLVSWAVPIAAVVDITVARWTDL